MPIAWVAAGMVHGNDNGSLAVVAIQDQMRVVLERIESMDAIERGASRRLRLNPIEGHADLVVKSLGQLLTTLSVVLVGFEKSASAPE